jgi:hypothetical protein
MFQLAWNDRESRRIEVTARRHPGHSATRHTQRAVGSAGGTCSAQYHRLQRAALIRLRQHMARQQSPRPWGMQCCVWVQSRATRPRERHTGPVRMAALEVQPAVRQAQVSVARQPVTQHFSSGDTAHCSSPPPPLTEQYTVGLHPPSSVDPAAARVRQRNHFSLATPQDQEPSLHRRIRTRHAVLQFLAPATRC